MFDRMVKSSQFDYAQIGGCFTIFCKLKNQRQDSSQDFNTQTKKNAYYFLLEQKRNNKLESTTKKKQKHVVLAKQFFFFCSLSYEYLLEKKYVVNKIVKKSAH